MSTMKEKFLALMRRDNPKWLGDPWSCFNETPSFRPVVMDAVTMFIGNAQPGQIGVKNAWGVTFDWPEGEPGSMPHVTEENKVIKDITCWRDFVQFPELDDSKLDWAMIDQMYPNLDRENKFVMCPSFTGMFEFSHYMMGFEDALMNYLLEPEAMYELLSAYTDWKIKAYDLVIDHMHPDMVHSHDDWGNKKSLFLPPTVWREILKPLYARFYGHLHERGVLVQHHSDCVCHEIVEDMVDVGIDMWQGVIPQNDIRGIFERTEGKLCLMGGIDMQKIDFADAKYEDVYAEVKRAIDEYMPLGPFIPNVTNVCPIHENVDMMLRKAQDEYGKIYADANF